MNQKKLETICVYCGSSSGIQPEYVEVAKLLGEVIAIRHLSCFLDKTTHRNKLPKSKVSEVLALDKLDPRIILYDLKPMLGTVLKWLRITAHRPPVRRSMWIVACGDH